MTDSISPQQPLADMAELARILGHHHRLIPVSYTHLTLPTKA